MFSSLVCKGHEFMKLLFTIGYYKTSDRSPWLLSVQVNRTPACMWGPASIWGPACLTTCQVCVILFKKSSTFMLTGYQYFVYFHTKTSTFSRSHFHPLFLLRKWCHRLLSHQLTTPIYNLACMRDPARNHGYKIYLYLITMLVIKERIGGGTSESNTRPVCGARRLSGARLLSEVLR